MAPQTWGVFHGYIPGFGKMFLELLVSKYGRFFQSIHTFSNFQVDIDFGIENFVNDVVLIEDFLCNVAAMKTHVLVDVHSRT